MVPLNHLSVWLSLSLNTFLSSFAFISLFMFMHWVYIRPVRFKYLMDINLKIKLQFQLWSCLLPKCLRELEVFFTNIFQWFDSINLTNRATSSSELPVTAWYFVNISSFPLFPSLLYWGIELTTYIFAETS